MSYTTKNYQAHGGSEWVIGGKLTFLPGATVEGGEGLFDSVPGAIPALPYMEDSSATTVAALKEDFNGLLSALRTAGVMAVEDNSVQDNTGGDPETSDSD